MTCISPIRKMLAVASAACLWFALPAQAETDLHATYLQQRVELPPVLSNLDTLPDDLGIAGAELALRDNQTTGKFLKQKYTMDVIRVDIGGDLMVAAEQALATSPYLIIDAPAADLLAVADLPAAANALIFNTSAADTTLRDTDCRANTLHTLPSRAMLSDALMQFAQSRRWTNLALITGGHAPDRAYAAALEHSAQKFGMKITTRKEWLFDADMRRNASQEVPLFTQDLGDYDLLLIADETNDFGRYLAYNTWLPRPVAGTEGLTPTAWSPVVEQWGAAQLQSRFTDQANRRMAPQDYAAWAALRTLGEAVTRSNSADPATLRSFILSDDFELAAFKGRPLSYRTWNGQLRQPIPLVTPRAVVNQAPLPGFLHQRNEMDSLGLDAPETKCTAFQ